MSTIGLYSTLYARLFECAELLDQVLIQLKRGNSSSSNEQQKKLGQLLVSLAHSSRNSSAQLLTVLLKDEQNRSLIAWQQVGQALLSGTVTSEDISQLEKLANMLEYERAGTFSKMRGNNAQ